MMEMIIILILLATIVLMVSLLRRKMIITYRSSAPFQSVEEILVETISSAGWKLLSMHDIQARLVNAGFDSKRVAVYEICKPDYAAAVLERDENKKFSALMPCRISIYELSDGSTGLALMNAGLMSAFFGSVVRRVMSKASKESFDIIEQTIKKSE